METGHLRQSHWRKSSQWTLLTRAHAALAVADRHVSEIFARYCFTPYRFAAQGLGLPGRRQVRESSCVSDEHYLPTLLASYGLSNQVRTEA